MWSIENVDVKSIKMTYGEYEIILNKSSISVSPIDLNYIALTNLNGLLPYFNIPRIAQNIYRLDFKQCSSPIFSTRDELVTFIQDLINSSSTLGVEKNGVAVGSQPTINLIEGSNVTLTITNDSVNDKIDIMIAASGGGGGGLPPDGTYGDVVVSSSGTVWTVTDDTSNQQVQVLEDTFVRGTRPTLNFSDDGGPVSISVTDNPGSNRVDIALSSTIPTITPSALTKVDDTNVTLTLGGTPATALLEAVSLTLGWTGTLADSRIASAATWNAKQNAIATGTSAEYIRGDGSLATFPTIPSIVGLVPYTGATSNVDLGANTLTATQLIKSGGTSSQFLKADGSVDSTAYGTVTSVTGTAPVVSSGGTTPVISMAAATTSVDGYLSSTDWNNFNKNLLGIGQYRKSGRWFTNGQFGVANGSIALSTNSLIYVPLFIDSTITLTGVGINVVTAAAAGNTARIGIYSNNSATTAPSSRLLDSGTIAVDATGAKTVTGLSLVLTKGLYWMAFTTNASSGAITSISSDRMFDIRGLTSIGGIGWARYSQVFVYNALPASAGTLTDNNATTTQCLYYTF